MCEECETSSPSMRDPDRLLTPAEFQRWARISLSTWRRLCRTGRAPKRTQTGQIVRIRAADALAWAEAHAA